MFMDCCSIRKEGSTHRNLELLSGSKLLMPRELRHISWKKERREWEAGKVKNGFKELMKKF